MLDIVDIIGFKRLIIVYLTIGQYFDHETAFQVLISYLNNVFK